MAIVKCGKGHYYDDEKYQQCPICEKSGRASADEKTMAFFTPKADLDERTIGFNFKKTGCDPVVGWLVCIDGPEKGRDFRIHSGRNFIGRDFSNDIPLANDGNISRKEVGYVIYEPKKNKFLVMNGEGAGVYLNGKLITEPTELKNYDRVKIASYDMEFIAYCKGDKKW
ncbi:MAG: FHA domain-containing protein [Clostridiales bacterium]|nr:FHA domain-containing protein [Clostridiales bacterium]